MTEEIAEPVEEVAAPVKNSVLQDQKYIRAELKSFATHAEAAAKVAEWKKAHKLGKDEKAGQLHRTRIRMRYEGSRKSGATTFDATLATLKAAKAA